jgi:hypothetical protein
MVFPSRLLESVNKSVNKSQPELKALLDQSVHVGMSLGVSYVASRRCLILMEDSRLPEEPSRELETATRDAGQAFS